MSRLLLSVVMPVYNVGPWVQTAVDSILQQTYRDFELIVVDDGSTDGTRELVASIRDPRVRIIHRNHSGVLRALAAGILESKGEWIAKMDGDDISHPERFQRTLDFIEEHPDCLMVGTAFGYLTPNGTLLQRKGVDFEWRQLTRSILSHGKIFSDGSTIFHRKAAIEVGLHDLEFPQNETSIWYRLLARGTGYEMGSCCYFYRYYRGGTITGEWVAKMDSAKVRLRYDPDGYEVYYSIFSKLFPDQRSIQLDKCLNVIKQCRGGKDYLSMFKYTIKAIYLSRSYQSFRKILEAFMGVKSLRIWKWHKAFVQSEFEVFVPETAYVSSVLRKLGLKFRQNAG